MHRQVLKNSNMQNGRPSPSKHKNVTYGIENDFNSTDAIISNVSLGQSNFGMPRKAKIKRSKLAPLSEVMDIDSDDEKLLEKEEEHDKQKAMKEMSNRIKLTRKPTSSDVDDLQELYEENQRIEETADAYSKLYNDLNKNKVNKKNCFALRSDIFANLSQMSKNVSIQKAGQNIEAAAKLYGHCVDHVHAFVINTIDDLDTNRTTKQKHINEIGENECNNVIEKRRQQRNTRLLIESDVTKLNASTGICGDGTLHEPDALFKKICSEYGEGSTMNGLLLNQCLTAYDGGPLLMHMISKPMFDELNNDALASMHQMKINQELNEICNMVENRTLNVPLIPSLTAENWAFNSWHPSKMTQEEYEEEQRRIESESNQIDDCVVINMLGDTVRTPISEKDTYMDGAAFDNDKESIDAVPSDDDIDQQSVELPINNAPIPLASEKCRTMMPIPSITCPKRNFPKVLRVADRLLSENPLEYGYFDPEKLATVKGPAHWKLNKRKKQEKTAPKKRGRRVKNPIVNFNEIPDRTLFFDSKDPNRSQAPQLAMSTLVNRQRQYDMPNHIDFCIDDLLKMALKNSSNINLMSRKINAKLAESVFEVCDFDDLNYDPWSDDSDESMELGTAGPSHADMRRIPHGQQQINNAVPDDVEDYPVDSFHDCDESEQSMPVYDTAQNAFPVLTTLVDDLSNKSFEGAVISKTDIDNETPYINTDVYHLSNAGQIAYKIFKLLPPKPTHLEIKRAIDNYLRKNPHTLEKLSQSQSSVSDVEGNQLLTPSVETRDHNADELNNTIFTQLKEILLNNDRNADLNTSDISLSQNALASADKASLVPYAKQRKKINSRRLKFEMWKYLTRDLQHELNRSHHNSLNLKYLLEAGLPDHLESTSSFANLNANLPHQLSSRARANMDISPQINFVLLLHLCNEMHLNLHQENTLDDCYAMKDFEINQD